MSYNLVTPPDVLEMAVKQPRASKIIQLYMCSENVKDSAWNRPKRPFY